MDYAKAKDSKTVQIIYHPAEGDQPEWFTLAYDQFDPQTGEKLEEQTIETIYLTDLKEKLDKLQTLKDDLEAVKNNN